MDTERILRLCVYGVIAFSAVAGLVRYILMECRTAKIRNAPEATLRATAYYKDPETYPVMAGRTTNYVYHITFHTESGEALKLYMNRDAYFNIPEGASGELMFQGEKLWRFTFDDGTELRQ